MSNRAEPPKPAAFRLDDPHVVVAEPYRSLDDGSTRNRAAAGLILVAPEPEPAPLSAAPAAPVPQRQSLPWPTILWSALGGLMALGLGLAVIRLIEDLYARAEWLGGFGLALAAVAALAFVVLAVREALGFARLSAVEKLRQRAETAIAADDRDGARAVVRGVLALGAAEPRLARARAAMSRHLDDIIDGADLVRLTEREMMAPLDQDARRLVAAAATRVSVVTAVSPRAAVDLVFVLITAVILVRRLADLYGGRPGTIGLIRLFKHVMTHLTLTGGMAAGDSLVQQVLGHGIAARLSARLGEGVLNGLLTARLGLAAIEVARPLPFAALPRPTLGDLAGDLLRRRESDGHAEVPPPATPD
jgi:putative membrane protein